MLVVPKTRLKTRGHRAFAAAGPRLWNTLPLHVRSAQTLGVFKTKNTLILSGLLVRAEHDSWLFRVFLFLFSFLSYICCNLLSFIVFCSNVFLLHVWLDQKSLLNVLYK